MRGFEEFKGYRTRVVFDAGNGCFCTVTVSEISVPNAVARSPQAIAALQPDLIVEDNKSGGCVNAN